MTTNKLKSNYLINCIAICPFHFRHIADIIQRRATYTEAPDRASFPNEYLSRKKQGYIQPRRLPVYL